MIRKLTATCLIAGAGALIVAGTHAQQTTRTEQLFQMTDKRCSRYAENAVHDYYAMKNHPKCHLPDSPRWQPNEENHYKWCLKVPNAALVAEATARSKHLDRCGGQGHAID
jgi:hypothetical protein